MLELQLVFESYSQAVCTKKGMPALGYRQVLGQQVTAEAAPEARTDAPWQRMVAGLQQNCKRFGANLTQLQRHLPDNGVAARGLHAAPPPRSLAAVLGAASLSSSAGALVPQEGYPDTAASSSWRGSSGGSTGAVSREEVGRATWTFLHTLAAQYPEHPSRQQQRDVKNLVGGLGQLSLWASPRPAWAAVCFRFRLRSAAPSVTVWPLPLSSG